LTLPALTPYVAAGHGVHVSSEVARISSEYDPSTQFSHCVRLTAPGWLENVPAGHSTQCSGDVAGVAPENVPAGQLVHDDATSCEYVPAVHGEQ